MFGLTLSVVMSASPAFAHHEPVEKTDYDFSRWAPQVFEAQNKASFALTSPQSEQSQSFSVTLSDLIITPESPASLGMMKDGVQDFNGGMNFLTGGDVGTILFYSAGATLGVLGSNLKKPTEFGGSSAGGNTLFLQDPSEFETGEFNNQYGLDSIGAQYAYARGHTGSGVLVSVMDTPFNTSHANLDGAFVARSNTHVK